MTPYSVLFAIDMLFPGIVVQRPLIEAAQARYVAKGSALDSSDVVGILAAANVLNAAQELADYVPTTEPNYPTALPTYPTSLPRFPDNLGGMTDIDGWSIISDGKVVFG